MVLTIHKKALWISKELDMDADDVVDMLLGQIKYPVETVSEVLAKADEYDIDVSRHPLRNE